MRTDPRVLSMKFRVVLNEAMTAEQAHKLLNRAIRTGYVPPGIEIQHMDWQKGEGRRARSGTVDGDDLEALRMFRRAISASVVRVDVARSGMVSRKEGRNVERRISYRQKQLAEIDREGWQLRARFYRAKTERTRERLRERGRELLARQTRLENEVIRLELALERMQSAPVEGARLGEGAEIEVTATTRGGTPRRR